MSRVRREPDYDFGPYEDEYRGFEIRDDDSGRGPLILVLALGVLLIFAGVVWNTYRQGVRPSEGGLPVIAANDAPYKRAPEQRGGVEVAGQDLAYYDSMDGMGDPAVQQTAVRNPAEIRRRDPVLAGGPSALPPLEAGDGNETTEVAEALIENGVVEKPITIAAVQPSEQRASVRAPVIAEVEPALMASSRFADGGAFQVQLSALRSQEAAQSAWTRIQSSAPDLFNGAELDIQRADLGAKGVFYRLRVGAFDSREAAKDFCADVQAAGKDCMVVAKASG